MFIRYKICFISSSYLLPCDGRDSHLQLYDAYVFESGQALESPGQETSSAKTQESPDKPG